MVMAERKGMLRHYRSNKVPGCVILASDSQLSLLPSRT